MADRWPSIKQSEVVVDGHRADLCGRASHGATPGRRIIGSSPAA
jgi:hypothetical protein